MYTVFGYDFDYEDFSLKFNSFVEAVKAFRDLSRINVVFIMRETPCTCAHVRL